MTSNQRMIPALALALAFLACAPTSLAATVKLILNTGGDDLRGGNDNLTVRLIGADGRVLAQQINVNGGQAWGNNSEKTVFMTLPDAQASMLAAVELQTSFSGGIGGDNWNLDRLRLVAQSTGINNLDLAGAPLFRFTGEQRNRRFKLDRDRCKSNADCDDGLAANGPEACVSVPNPVSGPALQCRAGMAPVCGGGMVFSEATDSCQIGRQDADGDGADSVATGGSDCDDNDARRYPGAAEICDALGVDEDCDLSTGGDRDADGDGEISAMCFNWGPPPR